MLLLIKHTLEYLRNEVDHSLKEVLVLENHLALAVAQENAHVDVADLFALLLEVVGFVSEFFETWLVSLGGLEFLGDLFDVFELFLVLNEDVHVVVEFFEEVVEEFRVDEFLKSAWDH